MRDNIIYELMTNKERIRSDMQEAVEMLTDLFRQKYIDKIAYEIDRTQTEVINHPTREIQLLNTLKLFTDKDTAKNMDNIINTMNTVNTIMNIKSENDRLVKALSDESVKEDGVYDIDEKCIKSISGENESAGLILILMCLFMK